MKNIKTTSELDKKSIESKENMLVINQVNEDKNSINYCSSPYLGKSTSILPQGEHNDIKNEEPNFTLQQLYEHGELEYEFNMTEHENNFGDELQFPDQIVSLQSRRRSSRLQQKNQSILQTFEYKEDDKFYNKSFHEDHALPMFERKKSSKIQIAAVQKKRDKKAVEKQLIKVT